MAFNLRHLWSFEHSFLIPTIIKVLFLRPSLQLLERFEHLIISYLIDILIRHFFIPKPNSWSIHNSTLSQSAHSNLIRIFVITSFLEIWLILPLELLNWSDYLIIALEVMGLFAVFIDITTERWNGTSMHHFYLIGWFIDLYL